MKKAFFRCLILFLFVGLCTFSGCSPVPSNPGTENPGTALEEDITVCYSPDEIFSDPMRLLQYKTAYSVPYPERQVAVDAFLLMLKENFWNQLLQFPLPACGDGFEDLRVWLLETVVVNLSFRSQGRNITVKVWNSPSVSEPEGTVAGTGNYLGKEFPLYETSKKGCYAGKFSYENYGVSVEIRCNSDVSGGSICPDVLKNPWISVAEDGEFRFWFEDSSNPQFRIDHLDSLESYEEFLKTADLPEGFTTYETISSLGSFVRYLDLTDPGDAGRNLDALYVLRSSSGQIYMIRQKHSSSKKGSLFDSFVDQDLLPEKDLRFNSGKHGRVFVAPAEENDPRAARGVYFYDKVQDETGILTHIAPAVDRPQYSYLLYVEDLFRNVDLGDGSLFSRMAAFETAPEALEELCTILSNS